MLYHSLLCHMTFNKLDTIPQDKIKEYSLWIIKLNISQLTYKLVHIVTLHTYLINSNYYFYIKYEEMNNRKYGVFFWHAIIGIYRTSLTINNTNILLLTAFNLNPIIKNCKNGNFIQGLSFLHKYCRLQCSCHS
jgi:hypothetical protein